MKQTDTQIISTSSSQQNKPKKKSAWKEYMSIVLIFLIGILGFSYVMNSSLPAAISLNTQIYGDDIPVIEGESIYQDDFITFPRTNNKDKQLLISGQPEAQRMMTFTIANYDENVDYYIYVDNGEKFLCEKESLQYAFPHAGTFHLELEASYQDETKIIYRESIDIKSSSNTITGSRDDISSPWK